MLVAAFQIHHCILAAIDLALDAGETRKMHRVFQHERMGRAGVEPDVADIVDFLPLFIRMRAEEAFAGAILVPGVRAFGLESIGNAFIDGLVLQNLGGAVALLAHEHGDRHAPMRAGARSPSPGGPAIMPVMRF